MAVGVPLARIVATVFIPAKLPPVMVPHCTALHCTALYALYGNHVWRRATLGGFTVVCIWAKDIECRCV